MAYFKSNEPAGENPYPETEAEAEYDDGFDDLREEEEYVPELSPEEKAERAKGRVRLAMGAGNLFGVIAGTVLILPVSLLMRSVRQFPAVPISF